MATENTTEIKGRRFIAVFHSWHVDSRSWEAIDLGESDRASADAFAALALRNRQGFYRWDYMLVEVDALYRLPRRLTWRERLTGSLSLQ